MEGISFVLEFIDIRGIKRNVFYFKGDNTFEIQGKDRYHYVRGDIQYLILELSKLGVFKISSVSPYWIDRLMKSTDSLSSGDLGVLLIYAKLYNMGKDVKYLSQDEYRVVNKILTEFTGVGSKFSKPFEKDGSLKVKRLDSNKVIAFSTFVKEFPLLLPRLSVMHLYGFNTEEVKRIARVMDRNKAHITV